MKNDSRDEHHLSWWLSVKGPSKRDLFFGVRMQTLVRLSIYLLDWCVYGIVPFHKWKLVQSGPLGLVHPHGLWDSCLFASITAGAESDNFFPTETVISVTTLITLFILAKIVLYVRFEPQSLRFEAVCFCKSNRGQERFCLQDCGVHAIHGLWISRDWNLTDHVYCAHSRSMCKSADVSHRRALEQQLMRFNDRIMLSPIWRKRFLLVKFMCCKLNCASRFLYGIGKIQSEN